MKHRALIAAGSLAVLFSATSIAQQSGAPLMTSPMHVVTEVRLPIDVSFYYWHEIPIVEATFNGGQSRERVALATGVNALTLSNDSYARNKVQAEKTRFTVAVMDRKEETQALEVNQFQVGGLQLSKAAFALQDTSDQLLRKKLADSPQAWIGAPFFLAFQTTFDFPNRLLSLQPLKAPFPKDEQKVELPLVMQNGRLLVKIQAGGGSKTFLAILDTGSPGTIIPSSVAVKLKLKPETTIPTKSANGAVSSLGMAKLPSLKIGTFEERDVRVGFLNPSAGTGFDKEFAVLGMNVLHKYRLMINFERKKILLLPPLKADADKPAEDKDQ